MPQHLQLRGNWAIRGGLKASGNVTQGTIPTTVSAAAYTADGGTYPDSTIIYAFAGAGVITLPAPAANPGRAITVKTTVAQTVNSASANVVPLNGGAPGTPILVATIGKWAVLQSDGVNWNIVAAN